MRSLFSKIFLSFWITEILIVVCTIFILRHQWESTEAVYMSMFAMLETNARQSLRAYETGGCAALEKVPGVFYIENREAYDQPAILLDPENRPLCGNEDTSTYASAIATIRKSGYMVPERHGRGYVEGVQVMGKNGAKYAYLMRATFPEKIYIPYWEILPRLVIELVISLLVTFFVTMFLTRPIRSLREAARQLAAGDLHARARWPRGKREPKRSGRGDELWGLVYDFNNMADRLASLVDAQKLLLRDVSHELRSPLARLSVALELAREEAQPGMEEQLDRIEREAGRLNALIGQLLSLSHLESTQRPPDTQRFSLGSLVAELLPDLEYEAQRRHCRVTFDPAAQCELRGNRELIARAIENVVRNAITYTAEGTAVEIALSREERAGAPVAVLLVSDCGPGVPEAALEAIFRPFYRLDDSRQRATGGYGVGLAIAERTVRLHGGEVTAKNRPDGGLTVELRLNMTCREPESAATSIAAESAKN